MTLDDLGAVLSRANSDGGCLLSVQCDPGAASAGIFANEWHHGRSVFFADRGPLWTVVLAGGLDEGIDLAGSLLEMAGLEDTARIAVAPFGAGGPDYGVIAERLSGVESVLLHRHHQHKVSAFEIDTQRLVPVDDSQNVQIHDPGIARSLADAGDVEAAGFVLFESQSSWRVRSAWLRGLLRICDLVVPDVAAVTRLIHLASGQRMRQSARDEFLELRGLVLSSNSANLTVLGIAELCAKCLHNLHVPATIESVNDTVFDRDTGWHLVPAVLAAVEIESSQQLRSDWLQALWASPDEIPSNAAP